MAFQELVKRSWLLAAVFLLFCLSGCGTEFQEVAAEHLEMEWQASLGNSATSWWYLGEKDGYYYLLKKEPLRAQGFRIRKESLGLFVQPPLELTSDSDKWVNLKAYQIKFGD